MGERNFISLIFMKIELINIISAVIFFFIFGVFAGAVRSNLEIPPAITK